MRHHIFSLFLITFSVQSLIGQDDAGRLLPTEEDYYQMITLPVPEGIVLEVGGIATLPNGNIAAAARRGEVWIVENPYMRDGSYPQFRRFATGMHEILGLSYRDGDLYAAQRGELTRLVDEDGDGVAELYETVYAWPLSGHYHEYSYGPKFMPDGSMITTGNVAFGNVEWWRGESRVPWRGWTMRITPEGKMEPYATGMRSPAAIGIIDGELFYADNQGDWMGSGGLVHLEKGDFTGHPAGLRWANLPESPVNITTNDIYYRVNPRLAAPGENPVKPENIEDEIPTPLFEIGEELDAVKTPAVWLPHGILGISTSDILPDSTGGAFGPFTGQLLIGDQGQSKIVRVFLEKVKGVYQGAAFNFRAGFQSGVMRMTWGRDGSLFVGQTNRGWGSTGNDPYGLQRLVWTGAIPFEMKAVRAMPDGFEIEFTQPVDKATASDPASYEITSFIYKYHPVYGSPVVNDQICPIKGIVVSDDGLRARLVVDSLRTKYIHEIKAPGVESYNGNLPLLHNTAYYTLNAIPEGEPLALPESALAKARSAAGTNGHEHSGNGAVTKAAEEPAAQTREETIQQVEEEVEKAAPPARKPASVSEENVRTPRGRAAKRITRKPADWGNPDFSLIISTIPGLKYDKKSLSVKAGSTVKLTFYNNDDMPHNIVFTAPGKADAVGKAALDLGLQGERLDYVPNSDNVLHFTQLLGPGARETIYFRAPEKPGAYQYVCTFPGHYLSMRGTLSVYP